MSNANFKSIKKMLQLAVRNFFKVNDLCNHNEKLQFLMLQCYQKKFTTFYNFH